MIVKKMMLTGACTIITPGSSSQVTVALLIVQINLLLVLKLGPFVDAADDWLAFLTSFQMMLTMLGGLLLMTDDENSPTYDSNVMGMIMVVINLFGFVALLFSLILLHPKVRKCIDGREGRQVTEKQGGEGAGRAWGGGGVENGSNSKVVPISIRNRNTTKVAPISSIDKKAVQSWEVKEIQTDHS